MGHADALLVKAESSDLGLSNGLLTQETRTANEPGFVGLGVGGKAGVSDPEIALAGQLLAVQWQAGFGPQRITGAQSGGLQTKRASDLQQPIPQAGTLI